MNKIIKVLIVIALIALLIFGGIRVIGGGSLKAKLENHVWSCESKYTNDFYKMTFDGNTVKTDSIYGSWRRNYYKVRYLNSNTLLMDVEGKMQKYEVDFIFDGDAFNLSPDISGTYGFWF